MFDLENVPEDPVEVLKFLYFTLQTKELQIEYVDKSEIMNTIHRLEVSDIGRDIIITKDNPANDVFNLVLPVIDEKTIYQNKKLLPPVKHFTKLRSEAIKKPFGLLEVKLKCFEEHINLSDNRHLKDRLSFDDSKYFIFNFDENVYIQVPSDQLEQSKFKIKKGMLQLQEIENELVREYLTRENLLDQSLGNLKILYYEQNSYLLNLQNLYLRPEKKYVERYLIQWHQYLLEQLPIWMMLKYVFTEINESEFKKYKYLGWQLVKKVQVAIEKLSVIKSKFSEMKDWNQDYEEYSYVMEITTELSSLVLERSNQSQKQGYINTTDEQGKRLVIENLIEIEKRNMLQDEKVTREEIEKEIQMLLKK